MRLFSIWTSGSGGDAIKMYVLSGALAALLFSGAEPLDGIMRINSVK